MSAGFFTRAQERFAAFDFIEYHTLDISADPIAQGFTEGEFDLVVAADVLHVAPQLKRALHHVTSLLRDHGALLALEGSDPRVLDLCFGGLDGFWQFTDAPLRTRTCLLPADRWMPLLTECRFTDAAYATQDLDVDDGDHSVIVAARAARGTESPPPPPVARDERDAARWLVIAERPDSDLARRLVDALRQSGSPEVALVAAGASPHARRPLLRAENPPGIVVLLDEAAPTASSPGQDITDRMLQRAAILREVAAARHRDPSPDRRPLVLVTRPSGALPFPERPLVPEDAALWGMARSLANEEPGLGVRRISLDRSRDPNGDAERLAQVINTDTAEDELVLTRGGCFAPRTVSRLPTASAPTGVPFRLHIDRGGAAPSLAWIQHTEQEPGPGQLATTVKAAALNHRDVMTVAGLITENTCSAGFERDRVGMECAQSSPASAPG
ncbi:methyltransferase [Actinomadura sp. KC216]|uniref:methyltransferase n=1 Tax=Actinomadura sp. KC216 TaxID=2530370 RepID=UPI001404DCAA|nr:methyltransferase [Actinomadura sp. KC216]